MARGSGGGSLSLSPFPFLRYTADALPSPLPALTALHVAGSEAEPHTIRELPPASAIPLLRELSLFFCGGIVDWPDELSFLTGLTSVRLIGCNLMEVPAAFLSLPRLEVFFLSHNWLRGLPGGWDWGRGWKRAHAWRSCCRLVHRLSCTVPPKVEEPSPLCYDGPVRAANPACLLLPPCFVLWKGQQGSIEAGW